MDSSLIGKKIKELRQDNDMRQIELARRLSVVNSTVSNWENGRRLPSITDLKKISEIFAVSLNYFEVDSHQSQSKMIPISEAKQTIEGKPLGVIVSKPVSILFISGISFVVISGIIIRYFSFFFLLLGFFLIGWALFSYVMVLIRHHRINTVRIVIPLSNQVNYIHHLSPRACHRIESWMLYTTLALIVSNVGFHFSQAWLTRQLSLVIVDIVFSVYALLSIMIAFQRYRVVKTAHVFKKTVNYYDVFKQMKHDVFFVMLLLDLIGFSSTVLVIAMIGGIPKLGWVGIVPLAVGAINVLVSSMIVVCYQSYVSQFELTYGQ